MFLPGDVLLGLHDIALVAVFCSENVARLFTLGLELLQVQFHLPL